MSKSSTRRHVYNLSDLRARAAERKGGDTLTIAIDGTPFEIPAPGFWPDEVKALARQSKTDGDLPFVQALMGKDRYTKFAELGGRSDDLMLLLEEYKAQQGVDDLGESSPSPTS